MNTQSRTFSDTQARREQVPLLIGIVGPSGAGKSYSALRLGAGIQRVTGGDIFAIDTESRRLLHYADTFKFRHVEFRSPFSPLDYMAAMQHCVNQGAKTIITDSMSHEHEGPGGVLELHEQAMGGDFKKQFIAWAKPKAMRRQLINWMLQQNVNFISCYRAKEKLKIIRGKDPEPRGWQPIAGEEYVYEATLNCLLLPASNGVPTWQPEHDNEGMIKLPAQFRGIFEKGPQLSEEIGEKLAQWAKGGAPAKVPDAPESIAKRAWRDAHPNTSPPDLKVGFQSALDGYFGAGVGPMITAEQWRKFVEDGFKRKDSEQSLQSQTANIRTFETHAELVTALESACMDRNLPENVLTTWLAAKLKEQGKSPEFIPPKTRGEILAAFIAELDAENAA